MISDSASLIAVIGPASRDLVPAFCAHYSGLGVDEFRLAVHVPEGTPTLAVDELLDTIVRCAGARPDIVSFGPWRIDTNPRLRDELRRRAQGEWHVLADADEFQFHPAGSVRQTVAACRERGARFASGLLFDRLPEFGELPAGSESPAELDGRFPFGAFLTIALLDGDPRKVTVVHRELDVGSPGNHFVSDEEAQARAANPLPVHHFKWRHGVRDYLAARAREWGARPLASELGVAHEARRAIELLDGGLMASAGVDPVPASLAELPAEWAELAARVWHHAQVERPAMQAARRAAAAARARGSATAPVV